MRKEDVITAKNYLHRDEIDTLIRLVSIFLDQAELRVKSGKPLSLDYRRANVQRMIEFSEFPVLHRAGSISHDQMKAIAEERYAHFDEQRRAAEALASDRDDLKSLEEVEKILTKKTKGKD